MEEVEKRRDISTSMAYRGSENKRRPRVLLSVSGSVAAIKTLEIFELLKKTSDVKIIATKPGMHFIDGLEKEEEPLPIYLDEMEWDSWRAKGDEVLHIFLRNWADVNIIAPLSANTLAKIANGLCDNLLTSVVRAWDFKKPIIIAPAMNTLMWENQFTHKHLEACREMGFNIVPPVSKKLACGDVGMGAMADPLEIVRTFEQTMLINNT